MTAILMFLVMVFALFSAAGAENAVPESKPKIVILATGGTIAGVGEA